MLRRAPRQIPSFAFGFAWPGLSSPGASARRGSHTKGQMLSVGQDEAPGVIRVRDRQGAGGGVSVSQDGFGWGRC